MELLDLCRLHRNGYAHHQMLCGHKFYEYAHSLLQSVDLYPLDVSVYVQLHKLLHRNEGVYVHLLVAMTVLDRAGGHIVNDQLNESSQSIAAQRLVEKSKEQKDKLPNCDSCICNPTP